MSERVVRVDGRDRGDKASSYFCRGNSEASKKREAVVLVFSPGIFQIVRKGVGGRANFVRRGKGNFVVGFFLNCESGRCKGIAYFP